MYLVVEELLREFLEYVRNLFRGEKSKGDEGFHSSSKLWGSQEPLPETELNDLSVD